MKIVTSFLLTLISFAATAQQSSQKIINTCGGTYSASGVKMRMSVGEPIVGTHYNTAATLSQGFFRAKPAPVVVPVTNTGFSFYPNPFRENLQIKGDLAKVKQVQVTDATGRVLSSIMVINNTVNLKALAAGMYTARLIGDNNTTLCFMKLIKQ